MDIRNNNIQIKEFLERTLGQKVKSYEVSPGCNLGDGYVSLHSAIKVEFQNGSITHYFLKTCPGNPTRQEMIKTFNQFFKEYKFYCEIVPEFMKFQKEVLNGGESLEFSIPEIVAADAINYHEDSTTGTIEKFDENYILMKDMRKEYGFIKPDNFHRVNYAELEKIVEELAKMHAVSWAFKKKHGIKTLAQKFPYWVENALNGDQMATFEPLMTNGRAIFLEMVAEEFGSNSEIFIGAEDFLKDLPKNWRIICKMNNSEGMFEKEIEGLLKKPLKSNMKDPIKDSWSVLTQCDIWINNMLFKYDAKGEIEKVCLLDFQISHETCPTIELIYVLYMCGDYELRKHHLPKIIQFYYETMIGFFEHLGVEPFPGFNLENLERRLHRARIYGILISIAFLPMIFNDPDQIKDLENYEGDSNIGEMMGNLVKKSGYRPELKKAFLEMAKEAHDLGIF